MHICSIITQDPRFMAYFEVRVQGIVITRLLIKSYMIIIIILLMHWALNSTHIQASIPDDIVACFHRRKPYPTQIMLAVVDFELRFTYALAG